MTDEEIVSLYWQRSEDAISQTSRKYEAYLTKIAYNILADAEDGRECVNDTYMAAWNSMPEQRPSVLSTYLGRLTRHISVDLYRKKHSAKRNGSEYALSLSEFEDSFAGSETPEQAFDEKQLDSSINGFLRSLPETARRLFIGRYYFFDSLKDAAAYCGVSEANAKSILFRTRQKLKEQLEKEGYII